MARRRCARHGCRADRGQCLRGEQALAVRTLWLQGRGGSSALQHFHLPTCAYWTVMRKTLSVTNSRSKGSPSAVEKRNVLRTRVVCTPLDRGASIT